MTKLVIFDLDGTLLNTLEDLMAACNLALEQCGCPGWGLEKYKLMVGRGIYNMFRAALPEEKRTDEMVAKMAEIFLPYYDDHNCDLTRPYDGILDLLTAMAGAGVKMAVASNKYQEGTEAIIAHYFGDYRFVKILGQREGNPIKPSPQIVGEVMAAAPGILRDEILYVGDTNVDMMTGKNAGVRTVGVTWGFRSREELASCDPWKIVDSPRQLLDLILQ